MAIYKFDDLLKKHNVTADKVTTYGSPESIQNSLNEMQAKKPTLGGKIIRETVRPFAQVATNIAQAGDIATGGTGEVQPFSGDYLGEVKGLGKLDMTKGFTPENIKTLKDSVKAGVDIGVLLGGGGGTGAVAKTGIKEGIIQGVKTGAKTGSIVGGVSGAGTGLEEGATVGSTLKNVAMGAGTGALAGGVLGGATGVVKPLTQAVSEIKKGAGGVLEKTGQKIQTTVIKPSIRDVKDGFKIENVSKYDVGGSLPETIAKTHTKMNQLSQELNTKLKGTTEKLNLNKVYGDTIKSLGGDKALSFGDNAAIQRVVKSLGSEIKQVSDDGLVDLVKATNVKRGAGSKGAWAYNRPEADSSAIEKVYTAFYKNLKDEIEKVAPEGVKDINKQISELIPINNAALRRMTVEERNNALSLMDNIGLVSSVFDPRALALFGTNRLLKSGKVGAYLTKTGAKLKGTTGTSQKVSPKPISQPKVKSTLPKSTTVPPKVKQVIPITKSLKGKGTIPENSLIQEARKYKSVEDFVRVQPKLYHGGTADIKDIQLGKSNFQKTFYMSESADYAKSYGGKNSSLNEIWLDPKAKIADLRNPDSKIITEIENIISSKPTGKNIKIQKPDGSFIEVPETKGGLQNPVHTTKEIIQGLKDGKAYFTEMPEVKTALKNLGYDGMITQESKMGANYGVWNKDIIKTKSQLTDIYNKAVGKK